jgi:hypothetical protein
MLKYIPSSGLLRQALGLGERSPEEVLDLPVQAAEIIVGPSLERLEQGGIHAQQERLPVSLVGSHGYL